MNLNTHYYRELKGHPGFIHDILHFSGTPYEVPLISEFPETMVWNDDGSMFFVPNPVGFSDSTCSGFPKEWKDSAHGLAVCGWYVHPLQLEETLFFDSINRQDYLGAQEIANFTLDMKVYSRVERYFHKDSIREIEEKTGITYIASILDLSIAHLPWLKNLRNLCIWQMEHIYHVKNDEIVGVYFNTIYKQKTSTLHLHIRVNEIVHPLDAKKRFLLDDVIEFLANGKSIKAYMIENGVVQSLLDYQTITDLQQIDGVEVQERPNSYKIKNPKDGIQFGVSFGKFKAKMFR